MASPMLVIRGLHKSFGANTVLSGLDLEVQAGLAVGVIGPNGAGKTTLFNVLTGVIAPSAGQVWFRDQDITITPDTKEYNDLGRNFQLVSVYSESMLD